MTKQKFLFFIVLALAFVPVAHTDDVSDEVKGQIKFGVRAAIEDHWDEAIYRWRKALLLDPKNLMAHNNLAIAYEQLGEYELALQEYQEAYQVDSKNKLVKNNLDRFRDFYRKYQRSRKTE